MQVLTLFLADLPVLGFMYLYLNIPTRLVTIALFLVLFDAVILIYVFNKSFQLSLNFKVASPELVLVCVYAACLLVVAFTPSLSSQVIVDLGSLPLLNWLRLTAGTLLGLFLPGYALITLFSHKLSSIPLIISSLLLTVFINSIISFIAILSAQSALTWMLLSNVVILGFSLARTLQQRKTVFPLKRLQNVTLNLHSEHFLLILLCLFHISVLVSVFLLSGLPFPNGDMWDHTAYAVRLENNDLLRFGYLTYPPFFAVHLFSFSQLAAIPAMNVSNLLGLLNVVTVLAFYALTLGLTKRKAVAFLSTLVFTLFGSFTFLVQTLLGEMATNPQQLSNSFQTVSRKTMQINSLYPLSNIYAYAPITLDLISVMILTLLFIKKDKNAVLYGVEALLIANLFAMHVAEVTYIFIFLIVALLLNFTSIKDLFSLTVGVWLGFITFLTLPFTRSTLSVYLALLYAAIFLFALMLKRFNLTPKIRLYLGKTYRFFATKYFVAILVFLALSLYGIFLYSWDVLYMQNDSYISSSLYYLGVAPSYFLPIAIGVPVTISVIYFCYCLFAKTSLDSTELHAILFLGIAFVLALVLGKAITYVNLSGTMIYRELRIIQLFGGLFFSVVSGFALYAVFKHFRRSGVKQKRLLSVGLGFLVLFGSGSTLLSTVFWSNTGLLSYSLNSNEVEALDFLKGKLNASDVVLTYSQESNFKAGIAGATTITRYSDVFRSSSSSIPRYFLQTIDYIYLTSQEIATIKSSDSYVESLLDALPVVFSNDNVTIFHVPLYVKTFSGSNRVPVVLSGSLSAASPQLALLDSLGVSYSLHYDWEPEVFENTDTIILTSDIKNAALAKKFEDWARNGGNLIVLGGEGHFSELMGLRSKTNLVFEENWCSDNCFQDWAFDLRGLSTGNLSITTFDEQQDKRGLLVNASTGGIFGFHYHSNHSLTFPFAIGTWFNLVENRSSITNSLILMNGQASGVGFWDADYSLDYYYDCGQIIYDIAEISPNSCQKIELYFPDAQTCYVYLNDTLVFTGPRPTKYDSPLVMYGNTVESLIANWFVGCYQAVWADLYYMEPHVVSADGLLLPEGFVSAGFCFNVSSPKSCAESDVCSLCWYTSGDEKVAPLIFTKAVDAGAFTYLDFTFPLSLVPCLECFSDALLANLGLTSYTQHSTDMFLHIEIYGDQILSGAVDLTSKVMTFSGSNITYSFAETNGETTSAVTGNKLLFSAAEAFTLSLNGSCTIQPLHDQYIQILIPNQTALTLTPKNPQSEISTRAYTTDPTSWREISKATIHSNSPITITARTLDLTAMGSATFAGAFFDIPYDSVVGTGTGEVTLTGEMAYDLLASDQYSSRTFGISFVLNGSYKYDYPSLLEIELPPELLNLSNLSVMLAIMLYAIFAVLLLKRCPQRG
ncbi:MAG: hypothetical protein NWF04_00460 [Candidatus Bathyarchaeota archaeon]|nr:hypothetical protein [Candidatus Bathyarchaeota archaeon]